MKTMLRILICTAVCCAAWSAFAGAPPPNGQTTMEFKGAAGCAGGNVTSVGLNGAGTPDVYIKTTTTSDLGQPYIDDGNMHIEMTANTLTGNPTNSADPDGDWFDITGAVTISSGVACAPIDLDNLAALSIQVGEDGEGNPIYLQNATCDTTLIGFRGHYHTGGGNPHVDNHFSDSADLTIECGDCGTSTDLTIGMSAVDGQGAPPPGFEGCWNYTLTVQNCTPYDLTGVKAQGGTAGWLTANQTSVQSSSGTAQIRYNNRNQVITWTGDLAQGESVEITVHVCGKIKASTACGTPMWLSGPWSATYTDPNTLLSVKTDYTGRAGVTVTCPP